MDPVSLIEGALVAGAAASAKDTASQAVKDVYSGLKTLLSRLFAERPKAQVILDEHEADPETYEKPLKKLLTAAHADQDTTLLAAAERVMTLVQPQQIGMGKFTIQNTGTVQGQNIADSQQITQYFGDPPKAHATSSSSVQLEQRDRDVIQAVGRAVQAQQGSELPTVAALLPLLQDRYSQQGIIETLEWFHDIGDIRLLVVFPIDPTGQTQTLSHWMTQCRILGKTQQIGKSLPVWKGNKS